MSKMPEDKSVHVLHLSTSMFRLPDCKCPPREEQVMKSIPALREFLQANTHNTAEAYTLLRVFLSGIEKITGMRAETIDMGVDGGKAQA